MRSLISLSCVLACVPLLGACVDNDGSAFYVSGHVMPTSGEGVCTLDPSGENLVVRGVFNVESTFGYFVFPLYNNQLRNRGSDAPLRTDPNGVQITSAEVELRKADGSVIAFGGLPNPFSVATSGFVPSTDNAATAAQSVGNILVIPPAYADSLAGMFTDQDVLVAAVTVFGETTGGVDVESEEWLWPIDLCKGGCLFECIPPDSDDPTECCTPGQDFTCQVICE